MDLVSRLRPGLTALLTARAAWDADRDAGRRPPPGALAELVRLHPEPFDPESLSGIRQLLGAAPAGATQGVLQQLVGFLAQALMLQATWPFRVEAATARDQRTAIATASARLTLPEALDRLTHSVDRPEREALERAVDLFLRDASEPEHRGLEAAQVCAQGLGHADTFALEELGSGSLLAPVMEEAEALLRETGDAYEDVLGFWLRRAAGVPRALRVRDARWHDLRHLAHVRLPGLPEPADLCAGVARWLEEWQLPPLPREVEASGFRLHRAAGAAPAAATLWRASVSSEGARQLLHIVADLEGASQVSPEDPPEARELRSPAVAEAHRALFHAALTEPAWLHRYLDVPRDRARDLARALAALELGRLREASARLLFRRSLIAGGPVSATRTRFAEQLGEAVRVQVPPGLWLLGVDPERTEAAVIEGALLAAHVRAQLRERFDEDHYRNPAASEWLRRRFSRGARETVTSLAQVVGAKTPLSRAPLTGGYLERLNA